jgi:AraC-like DNA-binding protein
LLSPSWTPPAVALPSHEQAWLLELCERLHEEFARPPDPLQAGLLASLSRTALLGVERLVAETDRQEGRRALPAPLQRFLDGVERQFARTRAVADYAREAGISARRLAELLEQHAYPTAKQVISERVVLEQKRLLAHGDHSVKELADLTGFADSTSCVKFFRQHTGMTPLEFRGRARLAERRGRP